MATEFITTKKETEVSATEAKPETTVLVPLKTIRDEKCGCQHKTQLPNNRGLWFMVDATAIFLMLATFFLMIHFFRKAIA